MNEEEPFSTTSKAHVTLGLVGVGRWGSVYLSTLQKIRGVKLGLVVSGNPETRKKIPSECEV